MRLKKARIRNFRSIRDSGWIHLEKHKTIFVGPNEAGKTVLFRALEQLNAPDSVPGFNPLRDYPRALLHELNDGDSNPTGALPGDITVVEAHFALDDDEDAALSEIDVNFEGSTYIVKRQLDNTRRVHILGGPSIPAYTDLKDDLSRLTHYLDSQGSNGDNTHYHRSELETLVGEWDEDDPLSEQQSTALDQWLDQILPLVAEDEDRELERHSGLKKRLSIRQLRSNALTFLAGRCPTFVYFSNYFRVRPRLHLRHLADRLDQGNLDDDQYDLGNASLLKLLGFTARQLSILGDATEPPVGNTAALQAYEDQLDTRNYKLNAASIRLTESINQIWAPDTEKGEPDRLRVEADKQYLKVVVEDELGVEVELDQRSEGFQWLVSFFVVFFAEAADAYDNAILLLDEPGLSLHGLKQREFRSTVSRLAESNQLLYTTHSPFMVGSDELDLVRVVELTDRSTGTTVHTTVSAGDSAALLPLQEALGYDLAQSMFVQQQNLVLEGLTDFWYVEATSALLRASGDADLRENIALVPAGDAGKVVYFATILHANNLKVAALLDSDSAGEHAATVDTLVHTLKNKSILRTRDVYSGPVSKPEIEDLLRDTLVTVAKEDSKLNWDVEQIASQQSSRPIVDVFGSEIGSAFSKYQLAKAYLRWTRDHEASDLKEHERSQWKELIKKINKALS